MGKILLALLLMINPFNYDLHLTTIPGSGSRTMICFHGYGGDYTNAKAIKHLTKSTLITFNFPDVGASNKPLTFGTIDELLPAFYVLKQCVIDQGKQQIDLYGFSAGGAVATNLLGVLNRSTYDTQLQKIGIGLAEKKKILQAIQNGIVVLDAPLKSFEEVIVLRGTTPELEQIAKNYAKNHLRPIDALEYLTGLSLTIFVYFEKGDEILSNRDDATYIERLKKANALGTTKVIFGQEGGHCSIHRPLWSAIQ